MRQRHRERSLSPGSALALARRRAGIRAQRRPVIALVQFDTVPMTAQMEARMRWCSDAWLPGKMATGHKLEKGARTFEWGGPYFVERTDTPADLYEYPAPWLFWFNSRDIVVAALDAAGVEYDGLLIVAPSLSIPERAGGQGTIGTTAIVAGEWALQMQDSAIEGDQTDPGGDAGYVAGTANGSWTWAAGVVMHEVLHIWGIPHPTDEEKAAYPYLLSYRGFHLPDAQFLPSELEMMRPQLGYP